MNLTPEMSETIKEAIVEACTEESKETAARCCAIILMGKKRPQGDGADWSIELIKIVHRISDAQVQEALIQAIEVLQESVREGKI